MKENKIENLVDFGCGMGDYAKVMLQNNIKVDAYDGNPNTKELTGGIGSILDLSNNFDLKKKYDCVFTLEVGEHLPSQYESIFLDNICRHTEKFIILSWAVEGQGGDGHVNCRNNNYVIDQMNIRNFVLCPQESNYLRFNSSLPWFKNTIMVFKNNKL